MNLFVDDLRTPKTNKKWIIVRNYNDAISIIKNDNIDYLSLDHDLGEEKTGYDIILYIIENNLYPNHVSIHSANPVGFENIAKLLCRYAPIEILDSDILKYIQKVSRR